MRHFSFHQNAIQQAVFIRVGTTGPGLPFVEQMLKRAAGSQRRDVQIPRAHRRAPPSSLAQIEKGAPDRDAAIAQAHATGAYSYQQIASHFGLHFTTLGKIVRSAR